MIKGALFSDCKRYRYDLWRIWDMSGSKVAFLLLNPSTADEIDNDPTVERCQRRATALGFGGMRILNVFAYRATDPRRMKRQVDPVGPLNDRYIKLGLYWADTVVCAWGSHGAWMGRSSRVRELLRSCSPIDLKCLGLTKTGEPKHPLYIGYSQHLIEFAL